MSVWGPSSWISAKNTKIRLNIINCFMYFVDDIFLHVLHRTWQYIYNSKYQLHAHWENILSFYWAFTQHESMTKANACYIHVHMFNVLGLRNLGLSLEVGAKILQSYIILRLNIHVHQCCIRGIFSCLVSYLPVRTFSNSLIFYILFQKHICIINLNSKSMTVTLILPDKLT